MKLGPSALEKALVEDSACAVALWTGTFRRVRGRFRGRFCSTISLAEAGESVLGERFRVLTLERPVP